MSLIARRFDWAINDIFIYSKVEILAQNTRDLLRLILRRV